MKVECQTEKALLLYKFDFEHWAWGPELPPEFQSRCSCAKNIQKRNRVYARLSSPWLSTSSPPRCVHLLGSTCQIFLQWQFWLPLWPFTFLVKPNSIWLDWIRLEILLSPDQGRMIQHILRVGLVWRCDENLFIECLIIIDSISRTRHWRIIAEHSLPPLFSNSVKTCPFDVYWICSVSHPSLVVRITVSSQSS